MSYFRNLTEVNLYERACNGDEKSAHYLVSRLTPKAYVQAWRILGNSAQAQEIVQEGFIRLFQSKRFKGTSALSTYFHVIVTRLCLDLLKTEKQISITEGDEEIENIRDENRNPLEHIENLESLSLVQKAILCLPPRQRVIITMWAYQECPIQEIANMLNIDANAAHQLLHRAKENLRKHLERLGYED